jgi:hypothetical protein
MGSQIAQVSPSTQPQGKAAGSGPQPNAVPANLPNFQELRPSPPIGGITPDYMTMSPTVQPTNQPQQGLGKGGRVTTPGQGGQPRMGVPNNYSNTVGQWDNASIQPRQTQSGKGKGY